MGYLFDLELCGDYGYQCGSGSDEGTVIYPIELLCFSFFFLCLCFLLRNTMDHRYTLLCFLGSNVGQYICRFSFPDKSIAKEGEYSLTLLC